MSWVKKIIRFILKGTLYLLGGIILYLLLAVLGTLITTSDNEKQASFKQESSLDIYIVSNGLHTDIVVPMHHRVIDWPKHFRQPPFVGFDQYQWISFGWGDQDFFLKSTQTGFPDGWTTIKAVLLPSKSLMHVSFYQRLNPGSTNVYQLTISSAQYKPLAQFILSSFVLSQHKQFQQVANGYTNRDFFFEARHYYHLFNTCNNWTNRGLKSVGVRVGIWTPFEQGVLYHLK